ncbi:MAG: HD domain-containing protein [Candidatus Glassbacteria bacterium]|nr:HD domain-containing protein [Candidatus Glassbacteria bacterium]
MEQRKHYEEYEEKIYTNPLACLSKNSRGRKGVLPDDGYRSPFQRDVHRITYSQPFRRLRHKTQVFFLTNNDHVCTRLEHSLYVAHASRTVARHLGLNEDLAEAIGLGHDIGHAPFGHHGEGVLRSIAEKHNIDFYFQHELNSLRMADRLGMLDRDVILLQYSGHL